MQATVSSIRVKNGPQTHRTPVEFVRAIVVDPSLSDEAKVLATHLALSAGNKGQTQWREEAIGKALGGWSRSKVIRNLNILRKGGYVKTIRRGLNRSNLTRLPWHPDFQTDEDGSDVPEMTLPEVSNLEHQELPDLTHPLGKEESVKEQSERATVQVRSSQEIPSEPPRPPAQVQKRKGPDKVNGRRYLDPQPENSKSETEKTRNTQNTPSPSPTEVDAVRAVLKQTTGRESTAGDMLPAELLLRARKHGADAALLCRWILDLADTKCGRRDPVASHGFFRCVLDEELPGWLRRNARVADVLIPRALGRDSVDVGLIIADEEASSPGPETDSTSDCRRVTAQRPKTSEFWKPPKPPAPPRCPDCQDQGTVERGGKVVRCACPAGPNVQEDYLRVANKYRGRQNAQTVQLGPSRATPQGINGSSFKRITTEDVAQALADDRMKKAVAALHGWDCGPSARGVEKNGDPPTS